MNPSREPSSDDDLSERLDLIFVQLQRQYEQLEAAFEPWRGEPGHWDFNAAFDSDDPRERNRAELVHANFERCHQLVRDVIELGAKLAERLGQIEKPPKGHDRISALAAAKVITAADESYLREQTIIRNDSQHMYVETVANQVYEAAERQLDHGRKLIGRLARWADSLGELEA
jgi:uncharacterized protein YutE (UPF0331/DUF86 family)